MAREENPIAQYIAELNARDVKKAAMEKRNRALKPQSVEDQLRQQEEEWLYLDTSGAVAAFQEAARIMFTRWDDTTLTVSIPSIEMDEHLVVEQHQGMDIQLNWDVTKSVGLRRHGQGYPVYDYSCNSVTGTARKERDGKMTLQVGMMILPNPTHATIIEALGKAVRQPEKVSSINERVFQAEIKGGEKRVAIPFKELSN